MEPTVSDPVYIEALKQVPALVVGLAAVLFISLKFLKHIRESEKSRDEMTEAFFGRIEKMAEDTTQCVNKNTEVLGSVQELLRSQHH